MKYSFVLKYIIGGAVVAFLLQYLFNEKDITFWMIVCLTIAVMVAIHMLVRVLDVYKRQDVGSLDEGLDKALQCQTYWADYDLELLLGDIYKRRKEYEMSERYYKKASYMCPCRFIPLYRMFEVYKEVGDEERYRSMAQLIIEKPVKVQSSIVRQIKHKVKREVK